jgi:predicted heme/steroid binding protein
VQKYYELIGGGRIRLDLFTSDATAAGRKKKPIPHSQVARHCHEGSCWTVFDGHVYDLTRFLMEHPGGPKILLDKAGRDCTEDFDRAHGLGNGRVRGMFAPYHLGPVTPLPKEGQALMLAMLKLVDRLCEAANVLRADWNRYPGLPRCLPPGQTSFYRDLEVHRRFTTTTAPLVTRAVGVALRDVHAAEDGRNPTSALARLVKLVRSDAVEPIVSNVQRSVQSAIEAFSAAPADAEELAKAIEADGAWLAQARDSAIDILEELEANQISPEVVTSRLLSLLKQLSTFQ